MVPASFPRQLTREVIFMQPLLQKNNGATALVIETGEERRGKPLVQSAPCLSDWASSAFKGSSMMMISAPRPVNEPPTGTTKRPPPLVVTHSVSVSLARCIFGNSARYQSLVNTVRN